MEGMGSVLKNFEEKWTTLVLASLRGTTLLEYQWTNNVAFTIFNFTDGCISIAEPYWEVNLSIISVEHRIEAIRKDNILNQNNIHGK